MSYKLENAILVPPAPSRRLPRASAPRHAAFYTSGRLQIRVGYSRVGQQLTQQQICKYTTVYKTVNIEKLHFWRSGLMITGVSGQNR
jgi:hypothetical protein